MPPILPPKDGYLFLDRAKFAASFAADVEPETASFMADSQVPWGLDALQGAVSEPAWKNKPSYYLVATEDKMIPPPAQRAMAGRAKAQVIEVPGSHAIYVSKPVEIANRFLDRMPKLNPNAQSHAETSSDRALGIRDRVVGSTHPVHRCLGTIEK